MKLWVSSASKHSGGSQLKDIMSKWQPRDWAVVGFEPHVEGEEEGGFVRVFWWGGEGEEEEEGEGNSMRKPRERRSTPVAV